MNLRKLIAQCRIAPAVYMRLHEIAVKRKSTRISITRAQIGDGIGINRLQTITQAMKALKLDRLIYYTVHTRQNSSGKTSLRYYKVSFGKATVGVALLFAPSLGKATVGVAHEKGASEGKATASVATLYREKADGFATTHPPPLTATTTQPATDADIAAIFGDSNNGR